MPCYTKIIGIIPKFFIEDFYLFFKFGEGGGGGGAGKAPSTLDMRLVSNICNQPV